MNTYKRSELIDVMTDPTVGCAGCPAQGDLDICDDCEKGGPDIIDDIIDMMDGEHCHVEED